MLYTKIDESIFSLSPCSFSDGSFGDVVIENNQQINTYAAVTSIDKKTLTISEISNGIYGAFAPKQEVMFHVSNTDASHKNDFGIYSFHKIISVDGSTIKLDSAPQITSVSGLTCQLVMVPNYINLTIKCQIVAKSFSNNHCGGIIALRVKNSLDIISGGLITYGTGLAGKTKIAGITNTNSGLVNKLTMNEGNGIVYCSANKIIASANTRFGATWSGSLGLGKGSYTTTSSPGTNGGAGYGGGGGGDSDHSGGGGSDANGSTGGHGGNGDYSSSSQGGGAGGLQGYYGGWPQSPYQAQRSYDSCARGGATVFIAAHNYIGYSLNSISTGGEGSLSTPTGGCGGGGGGYCYIDCPSGVPDPPYELAYYLKK